MTITINNTPQGRQTLQITRDEFDELIAPAAEQALRLTRATLLDAGIRLESVRDVFSYLREHVTGDIGAANIVINGFGAPEAIEQERVGIEADFGVKARYSPADMAHGGAIAAMIASTVVRSVTTCRGMVGSLARRSTRMNAKVLSTPTTISAGMASVAAVILRAVAISCSLR